MKFIHHPWARRFSHRFHLRLLDSRLTEAHNGLPFLNLWIEQRWL